MALLALDILRYRTENAPADAFYAQNELNPFQNASGENWAQVPKALLRFCGGSRHCSNRRKTEAWLHTRNHLAGGNSGRDHFI